jgi:4-hydroxyphenylpyruvate dioxygenase-like putative hemolysin
LRRQGEGLFAIALGSDDLPATVDALRAAGIATSDVADGKGRDATGTTRRWR